MLVHTIVVLLASGLLFAFLGSIVGRALAEIVFDPIWALAQLIWHTHFSRTKQQTKARSCGERGIFCSWLTLFALLGLFLLSNSIGTGSGIGTLLFFLPDVGLHNPPPVTTRGVVVVDSMISLALHGQRRSFLIYLPPSYGDILLELPPSLPAAWFS